MPGLSTGRMSGFDLVIPSVAAGTQPGTNYGTSVTPGTNAYGSYAEIFDGTTQWPSGAGDAYGILLNVHNVAVSTVAHTSLVTVGIDEAGGTSYTDTINHLLTGPAATLVGNTGVGGVWFYFPLRIREGSSIAVKASRAVGTTVLRAHCYLYCRPTHPELVRVGSFVRTFGCTDATTFGTAVTAGTTSEGAWTQLGSATAEPLWYWEWGFSVNDATCATGVGFHDVGVGDASNKKIAILDAVGIVNNTEAVVKSVTCGGACESATGDLVYARAQWSATTEDNFAMAAYAVGG